jgi:hypothetical protein
MRTTLLGTHLYGTLLICWSVLRFTKERIEREPEKAVSLLYDTINRNGGFQVLNEPDEFRYVQRGSQLRLDF